MTSSGVGEYSLEVIPANKRLLAVEMTSASPSEHPTQQLRENANQQLNIVVVFTSVASTLAALKEAASLANQSGARIVLVVPQIVPHPAPLDSPPIPVEFSENKFRVIASQSSVPACVQIYLCRDRFEALKSILKPGWIVVLGGLARWWRTEDQALARRLQLAGYEVLFKEMA